MGEEINKHIADELTKLIQEELRGMIMSELKRQAAERAVGYVKDGMVVGLGQAAPLISPWRRSVDWSIKAIL